MAILLGGLSKHISFSTIRWEHFETVAQQVTTAPDLNHSFHNGGAPGKHAGTGLRAVRTSWIYCQYHAYRRWLYSRQEKNNYHADAMIVVSITRWRTMCILFLYRVALTQINPRGVKGIYKLNASIDWAAAGQPRPVWKSLRGGFMDARRHTVKYYYAVDFNAVKGL
jgi:hypothetical protein